MNSFKSMTVRRQIAFALASMVLVLAGSTLSSAWKVDAAQRTTQSMIDVRLPTLTAALSLEAGINRSLAELRGYLILGEDAFRLGREEAWREVIEPALTTLETVSEHWEDPEDRQRLAEVRTLLDRFRDTQEKVVAVAFGPEDVPGLRLLEQEVKPSGAEVDASLARIAADETISRKDSRIASEARVALSLAMAALNRFVLEGRPEARERFEASWRAHERHVDALSDSLGALGALGAPGSAGPDFVDGLLLEHERLADGSGRLLEERGTEARKRSTDLLGSEAAPTATRILAELVDLRASQEQLALAESRAAETGLAELSRLQWTLLVLSTVFSLGLGAYITRSISRRIGAETIGLKSAATELQASSSQLLSGSTEQTSATAEFSSTIKELTGAASQIVERCGEMARQSEQAVRRCREGGEAVREAQEVGDAVKAQIETVVQHMLDLGNKSQEIGLAADVITELADQTTILSYNASIEAAAAGEAGQSFAVVAEQVGKLSDRAKEAVREVRVLIEEIQRSSNTTIMATEDGLKAAERGRNAQADVSEKMELIVEDIEGTMESIKEVEMSASQQSLASNQAKEGIEGVATAAKQFESSARQCLEMADNLTRSAQSLDAI